VILLLRINNLYEKVYDVRNVTDKYGDLYTWNKDMYELKSERVVLLLRDKPDNWVESSELQSVIGFMIPDRRGNINLRRGHTAGLKGAIILKFSPPIKLYLLKEYRSDTIYDDLEKPDIVGVENEVKMSSSREVAAKLFDLASDYKVIDFGKDKIKVDDSTVEKFIDNYVSVGGHSERGEKAGQRYWKSTMKWFHANFDRIDIPSNLYRGVNIRNDEAEEFIASLGAADYNLEEGKRYQYDHPFSYPISTTQSRSVALDFTADYVALSLVIKFIGIREDDIVIDMRKVESPHPAQSEIILRPDIVYDIVIDTVVTNNLI